MDSICDGGVSKCNHTMKKLTFLAILLELILVSFHSYSQDFDTDIQLAMEYYNSGHYAEAAVLFEKLLPKVKEAYGDEDSSMYIPLLSWAGGCFKYSGQYDKALPLYELAENKCLQVLGAKHPAYATSLNNLAGLYRLMGNYDKALPLYEQAITIYKKVYGANHTSYATSLNNLASLYASMGNYDKALSLYEQASTIYKKVYGANHPDYATSLNNLALLYKLMGNYDKAIPLYEQAKTIRLQALGATHPDYAASLNNLALLYASMGNYDKALPLLEQAKTIRLQVLGVTHPDYATSLNNLALLYELMGNYDKALPLYERAKTLLLQKLGATHPDYATSLNNLALLYQSMGNYDKALPLYVQAKAIRLQFLGATHPDYATSLNNLALLYQSMGNYDKALPLYEQASTIYKEVLGPNHLDYATSLNNLALLYESMGNYDKALPLYIQANNIFKEQLLRNFGFLSEKEKQQFMRTLYFNFEGYNSFIAKRHHVNSTATAIAYNNELLLKGSILESSLLMRTSILDSGDTVLIDKFKEWNRLKGQLNFLYNQPLEKRYTDVTTLEEQANTIEKELTRCSKDFSDMQSSLTIKWEDIQQRLNPDQAVIEFISFKYRNDEEWTDSTLYVALIVKPGYDYPAFIPLFEEKQLYDLLVYDTHTRPDFKSPNNPELLHQLYQLVWQPLEKYMEDVNYIYLSPTGLLNKIPFHALMPDENKYLIDQYDLSYLLSSRQLLKDQSDQILTNKSTAVLFGGIYYDLDTAFLA